VVRQYFFQTAPVANKRFEDRFPAGRRIENDKILLQHRRGIFAQTVFATRATGVSPEVVKRGEVEVARFRSDAPRSFAAFDKN